MSTLTTDIRSVEGYRIDEAGDFFLILIPSHLIERHPHAKDLVLKARMRLGDPTSPYVALLLYTVYDDIEADGQAHWWSIVGSVVISKLREDVVT